MHTDSNKIDAYVFGGFHLKSVMHKIMHYFVQNVLHFHHTFIGTDWDSIYIVVTIV